MARTSRAQAAAAANKLPTTPVQDGNGIEDMASPQQEESQDEDVDDEMLEPDGDERSTPALESDTGSGPTALIHQPSSIPRRRRGGRGNKRGSARRDIQEDHERDTCSDAGTPRKRGGWRGRGFGAGRWAKAKGGPSHVTQVPLDKEGNMANVKDDEVELPKDPEGEEKVDENGNLQGAREYRVRTFRIEGKGDRLYMLSTEPARCIGFRDSYLFFQKHKQLYKIILAEEAKKDLIERHLIPHSYKGRAIGVVTARSVFREFGSRIIIGGRKIIDDYQVAAARAQGDIEGERAVPDDAVPGVGDEYDRNRFVAWHGASSVYHNGAPSIPLTIGKPGEGKKRKVIVTGANWMFEHAREASRFNASLAANRRQNLAGVYDVHTNAMQYPKIMQPTHARWEQILPSLPDAQFSRHTTPPDNNLPNGILNGINDGDKVASSLFPAVPPVFPRNFLITDTYYRNPPTSTLGYPGPDGSTLDIGPNGLSHVCEDVLAELPEECRVSFEKAKAEELRWKESWGSEKDDHARAQIPVTYNM